MTVEATATAQSLPLFPRGRDLGLCMLPIAIWMLWLLARGGLQWGDGLELTAVSATLGVAHPPGYPLYTMLGWLALCIPIAEPYLQMLGLSLVLGAVSVWLFWLISVRIEAALGVERLSGFSGFAAGLFGLSAALTAMATTVEVYLLNVVLILALAVVALAPTVSVALAVAAGATFAGVMTNHLPGMSAFGILVLIAVRARHNGGNLHALLPFLLAVLLCASGYASLSMRAGSEGDYGVSWGGTTSAGALADHVRGGEYRQFQLLMESPSRPFTLSSWVPFAVSRLHAVLEGAGAMLAGRGGASTGLGALLFAGAAAGVWLVRGIPLLLWWHGAVAAAVAGQVAFLLVYNIPDYWDYVMAACAVGSVLLIAPARLGVEWLRRWRGGLPIMPLMTALVMAMPVLTSVAPRFLEEQSLPGLWWERIEAALPEGAAVITQTDADTYTFWYQQMAAGRRRDVTVYGANFQRFPWFRFSIPPEARGRDVVGFEPGPPGTLEAFVGGLRRLAIDPLLAVGPVYLTQADPFVMRELSGHYRLEPRLQLLTEAELEYLLRRGDINFPPPMLFEILPKGHRL